MDVTNWHCQHSEEANKAWTPGVGASGLTCEAFLAFSAFPSSSAVALFYLCLTDSG